MIHSERASTPGWRAERMLAGAARAALLRARPEYCGRGLRAAGRRAREDSRSLAGVGADSAHSASRRPTCANGEATRASYGSAGRPAAGSSSSIRHQQITSVTRFTRVATGHRVCRSPRRRGAGSWPNCRRALPDGRRGRRHHARLEDDRVSAGALPASCPPCASAAATASLNRPSRLPCKGPSPTSARLIRGIFRLLPFPGAPRASRP